MESTLRSSLLPGVGDGVGGAGILASLSFFGGGAGLSSLGCFFFSFGGSDFFLGSSGAARFSCFLPSDGPSGSLASEFGSPDSLSPNDEMDPISHKKQNLNTSRRFFLSIDFAQFLTYFDVVFL